MKNWRAEGDDPAWLLTVLPVGEAWVWSLSDGAGLARMASGPLDLALAEALSHALVQGLGSTADARQLGQLLFPGEIGDGLSQGLALALTLQLHPSLDRLAWEHASLNRTALGQRLAVSRQPVLDEDRPARAPTAPLSAAPLRVLRVVPGGSPPRHDGFEGDTRHGGEAGALGSTYDVILLPQADADGWARLPPPRRDDGFGAALVVATVADPAAALVAARSVLRHSTALLLARHDGPAELPGWWASLVRQLGDGTAPDEAVRQIRRDHAAARPAPELRLLGLGRTALRRADQGSGGAQRRQVTALSVDVVGSTRMLHELGAERYSSLLQAFHDSCADIMHRHGGVADDPQGDDGLMSYFGYPVAGEHAAQRAVSAALALVQATDELGLDVRIGVATGPVVIQHDTPVGVTIHLAARLQNLARPGSVLVSDTTRALLGPGFELMALPPVQQLKGIDGPQTAWQVLGRRSADAAVAAGQAPQELPLVGREAELDALWTLWRRARQGTLQLAVVLGEAGIGKSRLLRELRSRITADGTDTIVCRCLPDARSSAFFAVGTMLRGLLGLDDSAPAEQQLQQLQQRLPPVLDAAQALPLAAALLSLPVPQAAAAVPPERWREQTLNLLLQWFRWQAAQAPVCLLVEDTHWVDPSTRDFLNRLVQQGRDLPLLLLATRRTDDAPGWEPPAEHERIVLRGLAPSAARWLVRQACGDQPLPADVVRLLAARADGVPLFLEESVRMALDVQRSGGAAARGQLAAHVPSTLQDLLMARVDRLAEAKPTAQLAATLGRAFPWPLLAAVAARELGDQAAANLPARVQALERAGLLLRSGEADQARLTFRHALLRDTAYQSLWERDRRRMHRVVADVLKAQFSSLVERQPELLAYHQGQAGDHEAALEQWQAAARQAVARSANDEAITHLEAGLDALAQLPAGQPRDRAELKLQTLLAARCMAAEGYGAERVERVYARASALAERLSDHRTQVKVDLGLHAWHFMHAHFGRAHQIAQRALAAAAEAAADPMARIQARWSVGITLWHQGQLPQAIKLMDECLQDYQPQMHRPGAVQDPGVMCLCYSAWGCWELGRPDEAVQRVQRALALADQLNHRFSQGLSLGFAASVHHFRGETGPALDAARRAVSVCDEGGFTTWLAHARMMRGRLLCEHGRFDEGLAEMQQAYAAWCDSGAQVTRPLYLTMRAEGLALAGRRAEALVLLQEALATAERTDERYHEAEVRRLLGELTLQAEGPAGAAAARRWLASAIERATLQGKRSFVLRAALAQARLAGDAGASATALQDALAQIDGGRGTHDVAVARQWLLAQGLTPH